MLDLELPLRPQYIHLLAQPIDFLLVNHKLMLAPEHLRQLAVSVDGRVLVGQQFHDPLADLFIANALAVLRI